MVRLTKYSNDLIRNKAVNILRKLDSKNRLDGDELALISSFCLIERVENKQLKEYEDLEEQGKLLKPPCAVGDFALFSNGVILPVVYITLSNPKEGISIGCQNGIHISMNLHYGSWCKGFFKTREEAESALKELEDKKA